MHQEVDALGGGGGAFLEDRFTQQGIEHGALAGVELAGHHQQEELVELDQGGLDPLLVLRRAAEAGQGHLEVRQDGPVFFEQPSLLVGEDAGKFGDFSHGDPAQDTTGR